MGMRAFLSAVAAVTTAAALVLPAQASGNAQGLIAFHATWSGAREVYIMHSDGSDLKQLTFSLTYNSNYGDETPDISPDGTSIVYSHHVGLEGALPQLYLMGVDGSDQHPITALPDGALEPEYSPDGKRIVFVNGSGSGIFTVGVEGSEPRQITSPARASFYAEPRFSPNGKEIVYTSESHVGVGLQIHIMRTDGSHDRQLTHGPGNPQGPAFSPSGRIVFDRGFRGPGGGIAQIYTMKQNGKGQRQLTHGGQEAFDPIYSPDGRRVLFLRLHGNVSMMRIMMANGRRERAFPGPTGPLGSLSWRD